MTFEEQINRINSMFESSGCDIEVLPPEESKAKRLMSQNTGSDISPLAAVLAGTGGVSVNGILRLYGSGTLDFFEKNKQLSELGFTAVAEDIFGGIFGLDKDSMMLYFMPDELKIEEFGGDYGEFLDWLCCREDFELFYRDYCKECPGLLFSEIPVDKGVSLYPPLWENSDEKRSAAAVAMSQLLDVELEIFKKKNEGGTK
ncbi:MAG: DUF2625 family protein [Oscillospiraceae bacterium]|nr:DUF2625 family protein [Oscillospiraceae bacterium]